ncbi:MAG: NAD kinase [Bacteroidales bacterium]|nr:NAD kinase [Bacteroidales bacterium]
MKIALYGKNFQECFHDAIYKIFESLNKRKAEILVYEPFYNFITENLFFNPRFTKIFNSSEDLEDGVDVVFSIGGDGTFLECAALIENRNIPIVGINSGRLGFLASVSKNEIDNAINSLFEKQYSIEKRALIKAKINDENFFLGKNNFALNEITVSKKDNSSMINIEVFINNYYLNTYWADGLIISTPTGSTAYSLSSGGPIILPGSKNFVITPIAPHTLTVRPIVVPDDIELKIKVHGRGQQFLLALDFSSAFIDYETEIIVSKADFYINMVRFNDTDFFETLRKKLMWGLDIRN